MNRLAPRAANLEEMNHSSCNVDIFGLDHLKSAMAYL